MFKHILIILFLSGLVIASPACLLEEPLTNQCVQSIKAQDVDKEVTCYICIISYQKKMYQKAQELCKAGSSANLECGFKYFQSLLVNGKLQEALKQQYVLFFNDPFNHNKNVTKSIGLVKQFITDKINSKIDSQNDYAKAIAYFYTENTEKSLKHLKDYIKKHKNHQQLTIEHFLMARILQKQSYYYQALNYITDALTKTKKSHPYLYHLKGNFLMHHVQFKKAISQFTTANSIFTHQHGVSNGFSFTNYNLGLCYQKMNDVATALPYYQKAVIDSMSAQAFNALGHAYFSIGKNNSKKKDLYFQKAETYYKKSLSADETYNVALYNLAVLYSENKKYLQAKNIFQTCLAKNPKFKGCEYGLLKSYYTLLNIKTHKKEKTAAKQLKQKINEMIGKMKMDEPVLAEIASILYKHSDYQNMLDIIAKYLKDNPKIKELKNIDLMGWKGMHEFTLNKFEEAEYSFQRSIFLGSKTGQNYYNLGLAQQQLKKYEACKKSFAISFKLDPAWPESQTKMKNCESKIKKVKPKPDEDQQQL